MPEVELISDPRNLKHIADVKWYCLNCRSYYRVEMNTDMVLMLWDENCETGIRITKEVFHAMPTVQKVPKQGASRTSKKIL